ncbi:MAG: histidine triad nucleotide-binding protein [Rhodospirillaceae bacterium]|nr:histidine triad nucleotide-binding protein [Rhodospirillaceae bacterium]|tara:strand:+ start:458 stop:832 length:375 start_codon:yes stop_codon:yes gene_type:complete
MTYDLNNIFAKILRGEIPNKTVYENDHVLAFEDINPQAPVHVLIIPKEPYVSMMDFSERATQEEQSALIKAVGEVARIKNISTDGFRSIANTGEHGMQEVPHLHIHILGGRRLGQMVKPLKSRP